MLIYLQMLETAEEQSLFAALYEACRKLMYYTALDILRDHHDAEDAVHDAFVVIAKNMDKISDPHTPETRGYVVTITRSRALDLLKKQLPSQPLDEEALPSPDHRDSEEGLAHCLLQLPSQQRQLLFLHHACGFLLREAADIMGISKAAAEKLHQRAKEKLRQLYEEGGDPA